MKASVLISREVVLLEGRFVAKILVYRVKKSLKYPAGIKAKYLLLDIEAGHPRLLVDNHEPYGFHMHTKLPGNKNYRIELATEDYNKALDIFFLRSERIIKDEKK